MHYREQQPQKQCEPRPSNACNRISIILLILRYITTHSQKRLRTLASNDSQYPEERTDYRAPDAVYHGNRKRPCLIPYPTSWLPINVQIEEAHGLSTSRVMVRCKGIQKCSCKTNQTVNTCSPIAITKSKPPIITTHAVDGNIHDPKIITSTASRRGIIVPFFQLFKTVCLTSWLGPL